MTLLKEIATVTGINLRSLSQRLGASSVVVIGIACVVAVLVSVLALSTGLTRTLANTGRPERAIILLRGAQSEVESSISREAALTVEALPGIRKGTDGKPLVSMDALTSMWLARNDGKLGSLAFRGVSASSLAVRPEIKLLEGRAFAPGLREVWVGKGARARFRGLDPGAYVDSGDAQWQVVGVFESGGDAHESELLADADTLLSAFHRTSFNSVTAWLDSPSGFEALKRGVSVNPALVLDVRPESEYYEQQSTRFSTFLAVLANAIGIIMAIGAIFGALNTMHSAVRSRTVEIATLRALGFGTSGVIASVLAEVLLLALLGALCGGALAWLLFNGMSVSTIAGGSSFTQVAFRVKVDAGLIGMGIVWACIVGLVGGLFPAIRAARAPVAVSLRDN